MLIDLVTVLAVVEERNAVILVGHINPVVCVDLELCLVIRIVSVRTALHCGVGDISCVVLRLKINVKEYLEELLILVPADMGVKVNSVKVVVDNNVLLNPGLENILLNGDHSVNVTLDDILDYAVFKLKFTVNIGCNDIPCVIAAGHILKESEVVALAAL